MRYLANMAYCDIVSNWYSVAYFFGKKIGISDSINKIKNVKILNHELRTKSTQEGIS